MTIKSLEDFPNELLLFIISYVDHCDTLLALSTVSRLFNALVKPFIHEGLPYRYLKWDTLDDGRSRHKLTCLLLCKFLNRPILATFVRSLSVFLSTGIKNEVYLDDYGSDSDDIDSASSRATAGGRKLQSKTSREEKVNRLPELDEILVDVLANIGLTPSTLDRELLHNPASASILSQHDRVVALMSLLSQVQSLTIWDKYHPEPPLYVDFLKVMATKGGIFANLREYVAYYDCIWRALDIRYIIPVFAAPSIRSIKACMVATETLPVSEVYADIFNLIPDGSSTVENLRILFSNIHSVVLEAMLRLPRNLRNFTFNPTDMIDLPFHLIPFGKALQAVAHSLESFTFEVYQGNELEYLLTYNEPCNSKEYPTGGRIGSLKDFVKLKQLTIPLCVMLGNKLALADSGDENFRPPFLSDLLPNCIQDVKFTYITDYPVSDSGNAWTPQGMILREQIKELIEHRKTTSSFQHLKRITVMISVEHPLGNEQSIGWLEDIRRMASEEEIVLCVDKGY